MVLVKRIQPGDRIPAWFAVAWRDIAWDEAVCLPIGLHAIVSTLRAAWIAFLCWRAPDMLEAAHERGRAKGEQQAGRLARQMVERDFEQMIAELHR